MEYLLLVIGSITCAVLAIRASRLLSSALWLAGTSVFTALILYLMGAREIAVIELSVGAGLVTVLFVFAITIAGEDAMHARSVVPKPLAWFSIALAIILIGLLILPSSQSQSTSTETSFVTTFWQDRTFDVVAQIALIFAGVLGILGLLPQQNSRSLPLSNVDELDSEPSVPEAPMPSDAKDEEAREKEYA
jgi:NADH:ubiquinone oxidoreductase subunit 6 (subunit J)